VVVFVMALATFAMGLLPTYNQFGVLAPLLLVVVRLFQGLSAGVNGAARPPTSSNSRPRRGAGFSAPGSSSGSAAGFCSAR
jgi:MFS family permease